MASEKVVRHVAAFTYYLDRKNPVPEEQARAEMAKTSTLYVGNLSFYTTEEQIYEVFSKVGEVKRVIMGLDRNKKTPCGFCFVEYYTNSDAKNAIKYISGTKVDDRVVKVDLDRGFKADRQYGRGAAGGQVRDDFRNDYDVGRGGWSSTKLSDSMRILYPMVQDRRAPLPNMLNPNLLKDNFETSGPRKRFRGDRRERGGDRSDEEDDYLEKRRERYGDDDDEREFKRSRHFSSDNQGNDNEREGDRERDRMMDPENNTN